MDSVKLGFFDSPIHEATAAVIARVLEAHGIIDVDFITGEEEALFQELQSGDLDLFVTLWLPDIHAKLMQMNMDLKAVGSLYQPSLFLALSKNLEGNIVSIEQLKHSEIISRQVKVSEIIFEVAKQIFDAYELCNAGYELISVSDEEAFQLYLNIMETQASELMILTDPSILLDRDDYYKLQDPRRLLSKEQKASIVINKKRLGRLGADLVDELEGMVIGNQVIRYLEQAIRKDGMDADAAAEAWQRGKLIVRA